MAQHDQIIADGSGADVRADLNAALAAVFSSSSGTLTPVVTVAGQLWFNPADDHLYMRNATNTAWIVLTTGFDPATGAYTKIAADARFAPVDTVYTKAAADARFAPIGTRYSKAEIDAKFNPLLDPIFVPSAAPTKKTHFDLSGIAAGQDRAIRAPNANSTIGAWELIADQIVNVGLGFTFANLDAYHTIAISGDMSGNSATDTNGFYMWLSPDNGSTFFSTANQYDLYNFANPQTSTASSGFRSTLTMIQLTTSNQVSLAMGLQFDMIIQGFNSSTRWKRGRMEQSYQVNSSGAVYSLETVFGVPTLTPANAIRFNASAGTNPWNGRLTLHGLRS